MPAAAPTASSRRTGGPARAVHQWRWPPETPTAAGDPSIPRTPTNGGGAARTRQSTATPKCCPRPIAPRSPQPNRLGALRKRRDRCVAFCAERVRLRRVEFDRASHRPPESRPARREAYPGAFGLTCSGLKVGLTPFTASNTDADTSATTRVVASGLVPPAITVWFMIAFHSSTWSPVAADTCIGNAV